MTWRIDDPQGFESDKIAAFIVPYTRGNGLDIGCGQRLCWPHFIGIDSGHHFGQGAAQFIVKDACTLPPFFAENSLDFCFSSHLLEHIEDTRAALIEWWRVIKPGGHLVLYLPHKDLYPNIGQEGANPDHKHDFAPGDILAHMRELAHETNQGWTIVENETRDQTNEYSFLQVYRKEAHNGTGINPWQRNPRGKKRLLIVRFGAIGDQVQTASVLPLLKEQGYHVTYMTTPEAQQVLLHNPHIDDWIIQDKDQVPNPELGPYLESLESRYDKTVNFSESIEGSLLTLPGRPNHGWSPDARRKILGTVNYMERMHDLADVPHKFAPKFHATEPERREARTYRATLKGPVVYWALGGSSYHKIYPHIATVGGWLLDRTDVSIVLAGGAEFDELQAGMCRTMAKHGCDMSRVVAAAGQWPIRRSLSFVEFADVVVGPETGLLNAAAHLEVPKVIYLSHSSKENLTKHWKNTTTLEPINCHCFPCARLHYNWDYCVQVKETAAALCATNISPEMVYKAIREIVGVSATDGPTGNRHERRAHRALARASSRQRGNLGNGQARAVDLPL